MYQDTKKLMWAQFEMKAQFFNQRKLMTNIKEEGAKKKKEEKLTYKKTYKNKPINLY